MKWEKVKEKVGREVYTGILEARAENVRAAVLVDMLASNFEVLRELAPDRKYSHEIFKAYANKAWEIIMDWDIRMAGKLRELFPAAFPQSLRSGKLIAEYDDDGDWALNKA